MKTRFDLILAFTAALMSTILYAGCGARITPATITTPQGHVAYQIEDLVDAIGVIQHAAINANHAGKIPRPVALHVTRSTRAIAKTLDAAIDAGTGTVAGYKDVAAALAELYRDPDLKQFQPEIAAAQTIVAALAGGIR